MFIKSVNQILQKQEVLQMVEEIEVKMWNSITLNSGMMYWIRLLNEGDLQRIVQQYKIPFIFVNTFQSCV